MVIAGNKILTNAHVLEYATEVYVETGPGADKFEAKVESIGPDVDLAVLTVSDKKFFGKRRPLARAKAVPNPREVVEVYGFSVGGSEMSVTKGVVSRVGYGFIQVSAAIAFWSRPKCDALRQTASLPNARDQACNLCHHFVSAI